MSLRLGSGPLLQPPETLLQSDQNNVTWNSGTHVTQPSYFPVGSWWVGVSVPTGVTTW